jgi:tetratricopeptide (TPR) repeat protein
VRLERDHHPGARWPFRCGNRVVWYDQLRDIALIRLVDLEGNPLRPELRLRVATISGNNPHFVEVLGYPRASKEAAGSRELTPAYGRLTAAKENQPLRFGIDNCDLPNDPRAGWPGMSGSAVLLQDWPDKDEIWVYGVIREVPANFDRQLRVARLADAWQDATFRGLLVAAGAPDEEAEDPTGAAPLPLGVGHGLFYAKAQPRLTYRNIQPAPIDASELDRAKRRLAELPSDLIPPVAPLPPGSFMPIPPNPLFVGRETDLKRIAKSFAEGSTTAIGQIAAATGFGGIGKTQLAAEFVHRYGQYFDGGVFWLSLDSADIVPGEVAACGRSSRVAAGLGYERLPLPDQVSLVLSAWLNPLPRLLIFDNCEDEALLQTWRPPSGGSRVLITSRRTNWSAYLAINMQQLGVLERLESIELLRKHRGNIDVADADAIAAELGDLPLALHLAGCFLSRYRHADFAKPATYLEALRKPDLLTHRSLIGGDLSPTGHVQNVARTFALSFDRLQPADAVDKAALALLALVACLAPGEPIPRQLLVVTLSVPTDETEKTFVAEDAIARLNDLGLLDQQDDGSLLLHRLLARFVQGIASDIINAARRIVERRVFEEAQHVNRAGRPARLLAWQPHLRFVAREAEAHASDTATPLYNALGAHLQMLGEFEGAQAAHERALAIDEKVLGPDHPDVATDLDNIGLALKDLGDFTGARAAFDRALAINEKAFGPDHPAVGTLVGNLGAVLEDMGDLSSARLLYDRALAIAEKAFGPDDPKVAVIVGNLGILLRKLGDFAGAQAANKRALAIDEKALETDHPSLATFRRKNSRSKSLI